MKCPEQRRVNISGIDIEKYLRLIVYVDTVMLSLSFFFLCSNISVCFKKCRRNKIGIELTKF